MKIRCTILTTLVCLILGAFNLLVSQNVGINDSNTPPDANAILDVQSNSKGILFPRMTSVQRASLGNLNPTNGMLVFDINVQAFFYFINGNWVQLGNENNCVPVGTIMAFGGENTPPGFLLCNGQSLSKDSYPALFAAIGTSWGGNGTPIFYLPDLRGIFLRGWSNGSNNDPDRSTRYPIQVGGASADNVGSYQYDTFQGHAHGPGANFQSFSGKIGNPTENSGGAGSQLGGSTSTGEAVTSSFDTIRVGNETRPKNAYVKYIIKF